MKASMIRNIKLSSSRTLLCFAIAAAYLAGAASLLAQTATNPEKTKTPAEATRKDLLVEFNESLQELTARVSPSIVQVQVTGYRAINDKNDTDASTIGRQRSLGSGVIVDPDGYIITNAHAVKWAPLKIEQKNLPSLAFADYTQLKKGQLVLAFGSPEGLENSVSMGVVSAVARQADPDVPSVYIQTDAPT